MVREIIDGLISYLEDSFKARGKPYSEIKVLNSFEEKAFPILPSNSAIAIGIKKLRLRDSALGCSREERLVELELGLRIYCGGKRAERDCQDIFEAIIDAVFDYNEVFLRELGAEKAQYDRKSESMAMDGHILLEARLCKEKEEKQINDFILTIK